MHAHRNAGPGAHVEVILSREQRDAVYEEVQSVVCLGDDLPLYFRNAYEDASDRDWIRAFAWRLSVAAAILDQLGWQQRGDPRGDNAQYALRVDDDVALFMERMEHNSRGCLEDDADAGDVPLVDLDLDGISAARLALDASRKAVA